MEGLKNLFSNNPNSNESNNIQIFDDKKDSMLDYLPFNSLDNEFVFNNIFDIDYSGSLFCNSKYEKYDDSLNAKQIVERLNSFDNEYFKKVVVEDNKINVENEKKLSFKSNLMIAEKTLPGIIISFMHDKDEYVSEEEILQFVSPKFNGLRKTNGALYQVNDKLIFREI